MAERPQRIEDAPGLKWRKHKHRWEARWVARDDLVRRGYPISVVRMWIGFLPDLDAADIAMIQSRCQAMQDEMLATSRGSDDKPAAYDQSVASLILHYKTDKLSKYQKLRHVSRLNYDSVLKRLNDDIGHLPLIEIKARHVHEYYEKWKERGVTMAHSVIGMLRTVTGYGLAYLECDQCERLSVVLSKMRFTMGKPRSERITADQVTALRAAAHAAGWHSIALVQAFQFYGLLRQKDVIGEYVPISEPVKSIHIFGNEKWARGIEWQEIDQSLTLRHITSKRQKVVHIPLRTAPEIMEELAHFAGCSPTELTRDKLPASGPIIVNDKDGAPWDPYAFRWNWRKLADGCGIPKHVRNMDSRAGGISEAVEAGAPIEHVRHAATHSNITTTMGYERSGETSTLNVMELRAKHRNKSGTS